MRLPTRHRLSVGTACLILAGSLHAADKADFDPKDAAAFKVQMTERCAREQRGMAGNERMSDWMLDRTCDCIAAGMVVAVRGGLLDGIDKTRQPDVFWGRMNRLMVSCTRELVPALPPNPRWMPAGTSAEGEIFIDATSIKWKGRTATVIELENFATSRTLRGTPVQARSMKLRGEFNCLAGRFRSVFFYTFSEAMGSGTLLTTEHSAEEWHSVIAGTSGEKLWLTVCKGS